MSLRQICDGVFRRYSRQGVFVQRFFATESTETKNNDIVDITTADEKPIYLDEDPQLEREIANKRNKSRLTREHRNILMGVRPYDSTKDWFHNTIKYKKRMLGRYGLKGNEEPVGFVWPTLEEVKDAQEYERVAYPMTLQEGWKKIEEKNKLKAEQKINREKEIIEKLAKMKQWTTELENKIAKKTAALEEARLRKERLVEEVRRHFGFKISPHDEKFKAMLEQKEKEEKKKKKEAKKLARLEKMKNIIQGNDKSAQTTKQITEPTKSTE